MRALAAHLSDEDLQKLRRGGHDYRKVYAAYRQATEHEGAPTVILAKTIKGWTLGPDVEGRNATHQIKKLSNEQLRVLRDRISLHDEIPAEALADLLPEVQFHHHDRLKLSAALLLGGLILFSSAPAVAGYEDLQSQVREFTLDNGLRVIVHEDHKAPIVAVNIWYHVGSKNEKPGKTGFAHLFEHLMFNGSENYNDEYFKPFKRVGVTAQNGTTWLDRTNYFQNVPTSALDVALWMESDRMGHLLGAVTQEKLDEQRGVVQNEKRQGENQPYGKVFLTIFENTYPKGHPYAHSVIGSMEDLNAASLDDAKDWFKQYYGPNNAVLVVAGDVVIAISSQARMVALAAADGGLLWEKDLTEWGAVHVYLDRPGRSDSPAWMITDSPQVTFAFG